MGQRLISLKGDKIAWSGVSRLSTSDRGLRRFTTLDNCYVSQDGDEIRAFPGYATFLDLTDANNSFGYGGYAPDSVRPILQYGSPNDPIRYRQQYAAATSQTMNCRAKISHAFAFEQVGNEIIVIGESRFREVPIYSAARVQVKIASVRTVFTSWELTLDLTAGVNAVNDLTTGLNGLSANSTIYIESVVAAAGTSAADIALINRDLVGRIHEVVSAPPNATLDLTTTATGALSGTITVVGEIHQVRPNRGDSYPTAAGTQNTPYVPTYNNRPDDADALTSWRVQELVDLFDSDKSGVYSCYPAWVANRQRDFGDGRAAAAEAAASEGIYDPSLNYRGYSRREQRRLPFRPNVETALDRIILAVPQYGCMFQIPVKVPIDPSNWKGGGNSKAGVVFPNNNIYDKPRSLGIPKARMVDDFIAIAAQLSPSDWGTVQQFSSMISARVGSPSLGLLEGTYKVAISFEDAGTGDEGLASEPVGITIPGPTYSDYAYTIRINYIHPGYFFPECLALKMNVYIAPPLTDALAFYGQFELAQNPIIHADPQTDVSAIYGFGPQTKTVARALMRSFDLPLLAETGDLSGVLDATRLAPQSATMPRGASACKYIRGVLFAGGAMGNAGPNDELWSSTGSLQWAPDQTYFPSDEMHLRPHDIANAAVEGTIDGDTQNGTLGIAGRAFPDAYQGVEIISGDLFPGANSIKRVDRVLNRKVAGLLGLEDPLGTPTQWMYWHQERLRMTRQLMNRSRTSGSTPSTAGDINITQIPIWYVMPRGQMQIGDPGAPNRSSRAFIKIVDPNRGDDITAFGHMNGSVIICTRRETYSYSWYRNPAGEEPNLMSTEVGCIASNSMVEFDGGLAWISTRGPVALGQGIQHVGADVAEDFYSQSRRYVTDSKGMMRHSWGVHDAQRGLIMWGLLRRDSAQAPRSLTITYENAQYSTDSEDLTDGILSRFPCDEVLIWSYRAGAFSHWRPPAGLEIYWMRPMRDADGRTRMCFLAADNRIYALDDAWSDRNAVSNGGLGGASALAASTVGAGTASTTLNLSAVAHKDGDTGDALRRNFALLLAPGMVVELLDDTNNVIAVTSIASVTSVSQSTATATIELTAAQTWGKSTALRIGARQTMKIVSTFVGSNSLDNMDVEKIQMRYSTEGSGFANARVKAFSSERGQLDGEEAKETTFTKKGAWEPIGAKKAGTTIPADILALGRRVNFAQGRISGSEIAVQVEISGEAQIRIQDLSLEVG